MSVGEGKLLFPASNASQPYITARMSTLRHCFGGKMLREGERERWEYKGRLPVTLKDPGDSEDDAGASSLWESECVHPNIIYHCIYLLF